MFHTLMYRVTAGVNDSNVDMSMITDTIFTARNSHLLLTDRMNLLGAMHLGVSVLRARTNFPSWNNFGRHQVWPVNRSATPPSPPRIDDYRSRPLELPMGEELAWEESGNLGAATEEETLQLWLAPPEWNRNLPAGLFDITVRATSAVTRVAQAWSGGGALVLSDNIKGGWYALIGAFCQTTLCRAFRFIFPQFPSGMKRNLRPGSYCTNAVGNIEYVADDYWNESLGMWGYFSTLELPTVEVEADAAGADTQEWRLRLRYIGDAAQAGIPGGYR